MPANKLILVAEATGSVGLEIRLNPRIQCLERPDGWQLRDEEGEVWGYFDWVISTIPAVQATALLPKGFRHHGNRI